MKDVIPFPSKPARKVLAVKSIERIGFLTTDDRDLWIERPEDIAKIMALIVREKIKVLEGD